MEENLISIVVPVYNAAPFLERTLKSIEEQTYPNWELILLDDASADDSYAILDTWKKRRADSGQNHNRITLVSHEKRQGAAVMRNEGIRLAAGRYLAYLDADDYWEKDKLQKQLEFMREKDCAFSFTGYEFADKDGNRNGKVVCPPKQITYEEALTHTVISTITVMFDREKIPQQILFMPEDIQREDSATWWQILRNGYTAYGIQEPLSVYCRHSGSHSSNKLKAVAGTWEVYRKKEKLSLVKALICTYKYLWGAVCRRI